MLSRRLSTLPLTHEDRRYVLNICRKAPKNVGRSLLDNYIKTWIRETEGSVNTVVGEQAGRFRANTEIRELIVEMARHQEPEFVLKYREWLKNGPPKCCHTCDHYSAEGKCLAYDMEPPKEFTDQTDVCTTWIMEIPF